MHSLICFYLKLYLKKPSQLINIYGFYLAVLLVFVMAGSAQQVQDSQLVMQASWAGGLLAMLLSAELFFSEEERNGAMETLGTWPISMEAIMLCKFLAHFFAVIVPFSLTVLLSVWGLEVVARAEMVSVGVLLLSGFTNCAALTMVVSAMLVGGHRGFSLTSILVLPWMLPIIILGSEASVENQAHMAHTILPAMTLICVPLSIIGSASLLRMRA
jgi:heme exporter protein CcmB